MAGNILTPVALWRNFTIDTVPQAEVLDTKKQNGLIYTNLRLQGKATKQGNVEIFATLVKSSKIATSPAILLFRELNSSADQGLISALAKQGYTILDVDLGGFSEGKENYTKYPSGIEYANYELSKDNLLSVKGDATQTCWYEWALVGKYALKYLSSLNEVTTIGGMAIGQACTVLYMLAGTEERLDCSVYALNAGWLGYKGIYKFAGKVEPQFSDNMYKYIAGIDPQSYAPHIKKPVLLLSATNSTEYDCDRAYDTISRIDEKVFSTIHYSVGYRDRVSGDAFNDCEIFFDKFLSAKSNRALYLPQDIGIKCELVDKKLQLEVSVDEKDLTEVAIFSAEQITKPHLRTWIKDTRGTRKSKGVYLFDYEPYHNSGVAMFFAVAKYKSGFKIGSNIISKRFEQSEVAFSYKSNILFSSRNQDAKSVFTAEKQSIQNDAHINLSDESRVKIKKGPMGIEGITCEWGLITFKMSALRDMPNENAILMFDVYAKEDSEITVKLIQDYFGEKIEYVASVSVYGGEVWHNVKLERAKFKTIEGRPLKSYEKINALSISSDKKNYIVNNALWV